jgi:hypothetical protein
MVKSGLDYGDLVIRGMNIKDVTREYTFEREMKENYFISYPEETTKVILPSCKDFDSQVLNFMFIIFGS